MSRGDDMFEFMYKLSRKSVVMNKLLQFVYKCEIPRTAQIGSGVTFNHKGLGVVIHPNSQIEDNVYIEHHVCLGQRTGTDTAAPVVRKKYGDWCLFRNSGGVEIGEGCVIGACSLVLHDVPAHTIFYNERIEKTKENHKPIGQY